VAKATADMVRYGMVWDLSPKDRPNRQEALTMSNHRVISGRAPGHLRDRFIELIEEREFTPELTALTGQLWNCTDIVPGSVCDWLDQPVGSTYAQLVRHVRSVM
jgi:hypothetical protein